MPISKRGVKSGVKDKAEPAIKLENKNKEPAKRKLKGSAWPDEDNSSLNNSDVEKKEQSSENDENYVPVSK